MIFDMVKLESSKVLPLLWKKTDLQYMLKRSTVIFSMTRVKYIHMIMNEHDGLMTHTFTAV